MANQYSGQDNLNARQMILLSSTAMKQQTASATVALPLTNNIIPIQLNPVGLNTKIVVEVTGTVAASGNGEIQNLTPWGLANLFSNVTVTDLNNYQRVNTSGWHLALLAGLRRGGPYGGAHLVQTIGQFGANYPVQAAPQAVVAAQNFRCYVEIPLAYAPDNLKGAIFANSVNSNWSMQLTVNPGFFALSAGDPTLAAYVSSDNVNKGLLTNLKYTVYQYYYSDLPYAGGVPVLPLFDMGTAYLLNNQAYPNLVANADFNIPYANYRQTLSLCSIFDNGGTLNAGSDLNYLGIQTATLLFTTKVTPYLNAMETRDLIGDDPPAGTYVLNTRQRPIITTQAGNVNAVFNPSVVNAGATIYAGWESFAALAQVVNAASLAGA